MTRKKDSLERNAWAVALGVAGAVTGGLSLGLAGLVVGHTLDEEGRPRRRKGRQVMTKKRAFISFDYDHDEDLRTMLAGQAKNPDTPFDFFDRSVKEPMTGDWKEKVKGRISNTDLTIVICGTSTHTATGVSTELAITRELGKPYFLLKGRAEKSCTAPTAALSSDKIYSWTWENLKILVGGGR